jgi:hypothetical protein
MLRLARMFLNSARPPRRVNWPPTFHRRHMLMAMNVAETKQVFPFPQEQVFDAALAVLGPAGFQVKTHDRVIGRITASAGMSAFSWGEDLVLQVVKRDEASSEMSVSSHLKVGVNLAATAKNAKNAERIIGAVSNYLQGGGRDVAHAVSAAPSASSPAILWVIAGLIFLLMLFSIANM